MERLEIPRDEPPCLIVGIDTEAEFDWRQPFGRSHRGVDSVGEQHLALDIFSRFGIVPTYMIDYSVADDATAVEVLGAYRDAGRCEIGAHLNPWINPPFEERVDAFHSYAGNLPADLQRRKVESLTNLIAERLGGPPRAYRAGRFGIGPDTPAILAALGYRVDMSVVPFTSFGRDGGPDFRGFDYKPFWFGSDRRLLEIPVTCGFTGWISGLGPRVFPMLSSRGGMRLRLPGLLARFGALERIRLTPEGMTFDDLCRLSRSLVDAGCRVFSFTFHSPSLVPGNTPFVRDSAELNVLLHTIERYCDYFINTLGGRAATATEIHRRFSGDPASGPPSQE